MNKLLSIGSSDRKQCGQPASYRKSIGKVDFPSPRIGRLMEKVQFSYLLEMENRDWIMVQ